MHSGTFHDPLDLTVVSRHATSEGVVSYLRCGCGAWEVRTTGPRGLAGLVAAPKAAADMY
jgi:hypothetical protein